MKPVDTRHPGRRRRPPLGRGAIGLLVALAFIPLLPAAGGADAGAVEKEVPLLLKILTYDRALDDRVADTLTVSVLYKEGDRISKESAGDVYNVLESYTNKTLAGRPLASRLVPIDEKIVLRVLLDSLPSGAFYLSSGLEDQLQTILDVSRRAGVATLTGTGLYVYSGASVCVSSDVEHPVVINLQASRAEGIDFDARMLRLFHVIE
jgi:hypothetical protein